MSIGAALKLFVLALIVFALAFGLRRTFFWDVTPVSWDRSRNRSGRWAQHFCCARSRISLRSWPASL